MAPASKSRRRTHKYFFNSSTAHPNDCWKQAVVARAQAQTARKIALDGFEATHITHVASRDTAQHPVCQSARRTAQHETLGPPLATSRNKCVTAIHRLNQAVDFFWGVLKVAIHHHHYIATTRLNSRVHCSALATITRKKDTTERWKFQAQVTNHCFSTVSRTITHNDDFICSIDRQQSGIGSTDKLSNTRLFVVHRRNYRYCHG
jgi:hypothetical protein